MDDGTGYVKISLIFQRPPELQNPVTHQIGLTEEQVQDGEGAGQEMTCSGENRLCIGLVMN